MIEQLFLQAINHLWSLDAPMYAKVHSDKKITFAPT